MLKEIEVVQDELVMSAELEFIKNNEPGDEDNE